MVSCESRWFEIIRDIEEMAEDESLCEYCHAEPGIFPDSYGNPCSCEGLYCSDAYEKYLDENGFSKRAVKVKDKTKVTIERD